MTKSQRKNKLERFKKLIRRHGKKSFDRIIFSDVKLFSTEQSLNAKYDVVHFTNFKDMPETFVQSIVFKTRILLRFAEQSQCKNDSEIH